MGIKFGEIDAIQILQNEYRIMVLERLLEEIAHRNLHLNMPTPDELDRIREQVVKRLKQKYPKSDIEFKKG